MNHESGLFLDFCLQVNKKQQESGIHRYCKQTDGQNVIKHEETDTKDRQGHASCPLCLPDSDYDPAYVIPV